MKPLVALFGSMWMCATSAPAQSYSIDWFKVASGGGTRTGGTFAVCGTIGQPEANAQPMSGGGFTLTCGFWSFLAVQTPGAPWLSVERQGANGRVFWPLPAASPHATAAVEARKFFRVKIP